MRLLHLVAPCQSKEFGGEVEYMFSVKSLCTITPYCLFQACKSGMMGTVLTSECGSDTQLITGMEYRCVVLDVYREMDKQGKAYYENNTILIHIFAKE